MKVYQLEESDEEVTLLVGVESPKKAGRAAAEVRAANLNLEKESSEHFK